LKVRHIAGGQRHAKQKQCAYVSIINNNYYNNKNNKNSIFKTNHYNKDFYITRERINLLI